MRTISVAAGVVVAAGSGLLTLSLMLPIKVWRTGEMPVPPLRVQPATSFAPSPVRLWIDTDSACGHGPKTDPDDCLALLALLQERGVDVIGVSTVFGNAALADVDDTTRALVAQVQRDRLASVPVYRGAAAPLTAEGRATSAPPEALHALRDALQRAPLTILALGPLTNIALALDGRHDLQANVVRLVAVMGRRRGHVFHPIEGASARSFLGHGPIFRDFNVTEDPQAAAQVVAMGLPMTLIPYEAARGVVVADSMVDRMEAAGGARAWVAARARPWLAYWRDDIGLPGFYPFDLVAAAYVADPSVVRCARVPVTVEDDTWIFGWLGYWALFVTPEEQPVSAYARGSADYCPEISEHLQHWIASRLTHGSGIPPASS